MDEMDEMRKKAKLFQLVKTGKLAETVRLDKMQNLNSFIPLVSMVK